MKLTEDNYFSPEAEKEYFSASQVKTFLNCEAMWKAEKNGLWKRPGSQALAIGSYVDAALTGDPEKFRAEHPEMVKRDGTLKAEYVQAETMIARAKNDSMFMDYIHGEHQRIITGEIDGIPFKAKPDVIHENIAGKPTIVDLKTVRDLRPVYVPGKGRVNFAEAWNWPLQLAIYRELMGGSADCLLAVITKETPPDLQLIWIPPATLDAEMELLHRVLPRMDAINRGLLKPERCCFCAYCRETHVVDDVLSLDDFDEFGGIEE